MFLQPDEDCEETVQDHSQSAVDLYLARPTATKKHLNSLEDANIDNMVQEAKGSAEKSEQLCIVMPVVYRFFRLLPDTHSKAPSEYTELPSCAEKSV